MNIDKISELLGSSADSLLNHTSKTIAKEHLHLPSPNVIDNYLWSWPFGQYRLYEHPSGGPGD